MTLTETQVAYLGRAIAAIGESRMAPYFRKANNDRLAALALYHWNVELCKAF